MPLSGSHAVPGGSFTFRAEPAPNTAGPADWPPPGEAETQSQPLEIHPTAITPPTHRALFNPPCCAAAGRSQPHSGYDSLSGGFRFGTNSPWEFVVPVQPGRPAQNPVWPVQPPTWPTSTWWPATRPAGTSPAATTATVTPQYVWERQHAYAARSQPRFAATMPFCDFLLLQGRRHAIAPRGSKPRLRSGAFPPGGAACRGWRHTGSGQRGGDVPSRERQLTGSSGRSSIHNTNNPLN